MGKKIGEEITQKIKSAVKAKLIELGIEVDNELPDYIMVLVANKKTQAQMENDLQLFLGANTLLFTTWLVNVLKKLEEVTVSKKNYKRIEVTSQGGGVIVTKKEEDYDRRRELRLAARVKLEPGTSQSETESTLPTPETDVPQEPSIEEDEDRNEVGDNQEDESNSSEEETETNSKNGVEDDANEFANTSEQTLDTELISNDENSLGKPSGNLAESDTVAADQDHGADSNDDGSEALETRERDESLEKELSDSSHPKDINEQIDEVMEKTINRNKQPRRDSDKFLDDQDKEEIRFSDRRESPDENSRSYDNRRRSVENEFYRGAEKLRDDYDRSPDRFRNTGRRSPDRFRDTRRSPYNDRLRDKRSPYNDRFRDSGRRSYDNDRPRDSWRRSPDNRRRNYSDDRRSPEFRRRSPIPRRRGTDYDRSQDFRRRSPVNRQRSFEDKRVSPVNRRRSPIGRRRSPIDRRRPIIERKLYSDREEYNDTRKLTQDKGRPKLMDAREILKRKNNQLKNVSPADDLSDEEMPKRRKGLVSMVKKPGGTREREKSKEPQIPSLVKVTPRPVRNEAIQPNKKLLLLAVADAEKSITRKPASTRKRSLSRSDERKISERRTSDSSNSGYIPPEKIFITLTNNKNYSDKYEARSYVSREVSAKKLYEDAEINLEDELYQDHYFDYEQAAYEAEALDDDGDEKEDEYVPQPVSGRALQNLKAKLLSSENKCIISLESSPERSCDEWEEIVNNAGPDIVNTNPSDVTTVNTETKTEDGFEWNRLGPAPIATVKPLAQGSVVEEKYKGEAVHKALERCKYWPSCLSINCIYFHPTAPCQMFPACKSGKDCLFVHPDCKFGTACLNPKCIYLHREISEKKKAIEVIVSAPELPVGKPAPPLIKCVYFPHCKNLNCKFWHPVKNCKFGKACARSDCYFFHPTVVVPPKQLLTWTAKT